MESFDDVELIAVRMAVAVEPSFFVEADGIHHQSVTLPFSDRVAHIGGSDVTGMRAAIRENLANGVVIFENHDDFFGGLHDLKRKRLEVDSRRAGREAVPQNR